MSSQVKRSCTARLWIVSALSPVWISLLGNMAIAQTPLPNSSSTESEGASQRLEEAATDTPTIPETLPLPPESSERRRDGFPANEDVANYLLGAGDQIDILVIGFEEFTQTQTVLPDGTITVPLVGPILVSGRTLTAVQAEITQQLAEYLVDPVVELDLSALRPLLITVGGAVFRPGPLQLDSLTATSTLPTLSTALVSAGGVRRTADLRKITIQRQLSDGAQTTLTVDLWDAIFKGTQGENAFIQDGDIIFVPEAPEAAGIDPQLVARSSLAPELITVRIIGEVNRPGEIDVSPDSTVLAAMAAAGGHRSDANLRKVALLRLGDGGQVEGQSLNLKDLDDVTPIQNGDIIVVPKKGYLNVLDNISRTLQPITAPFNFLFLFDNFFTD